MAKTKLQINPNGTLQDALQQLINQYNNTPTYTPKTSGQLRSQAQNEYGEYYNNLRLGATQAYDRSSLALQQQRAALADTYNQQLDASAQAYRTAVSEADRHDLARGMQRSTYNSQVTANLRQKGNEAQQNIWNQRAKAEGNIDAQQAQMAQQLAEQLRQYDASEAADVLKRIQQLEDQEYERGMTDAQYQNSLAGQIYGYMSQQAAQDQEQERWQKQFDYQLQRDTVTDRRYDEQQAYQRERDQVSDDQWRQQFERQQARDAASDEQWQKQFGYQQQRDTVTDQRYDQQFAYQQQRDTVSDDQWRQQFERQQARDTVSDEQWEKQFAESVRQFNVQHPETPAATGGGYGGGSSSSKKKNSSSSGTTTQQTQQSASRSAYDALLALANAGNTGSTAGTTGTQGATVKTLQGPLNLNALNTANKYASQTGQLFTSPLATLKNVTTNVKGGTSALGNAIAAKYNLNANKTKTSTKNPVTNPVTKEIKYVNSVK